MFEGIKGEISLILEAAVKHRVLYELGQGKSFSNIVYYACKNTNVKHLINEQMPNLLEKALRARNFRFIWQWIFSDETALKTLSVF